MNFKDVLRIGLLLSLTVINSILFSFAALSVKLLPLTFNYILVSILFVIVSIWFVIIYYHGFRNTLNSLFQSKQNLLGKSLLGGILAYSIFLSVMFFIPGIFYLGTNLAYIKWMQN